jgi:exopolyphosphatase/guanosine-5'-triphosphate,3'-diphosphate pyrophosphatase
VLQENKDNAQLLRLTILLRIGIVLNHIRGEHLSSYRIKAESRRLSLSFKSGWLKEHPLTAADCERERIYLQKAGFKLEAR